MDGRCTCRGLPVRTRRARIRRMRLPTPLLLITLLSACAPRTGTVPAGEPRATAAPEAARPHRIEPDLAAVLADADTLRIAEVVPGVRHAYAWSSAGPWAIHVLEIDGAVCRPRIEARMPGSRLDGRARTSELAADAIAAVNADFFTPTGAPVARRSGRGKCSWGLSRARCSRCRGRRRAAPRARRLLRPRRGSGARPCAATSPAALTPCGSPRSTGRRRPGRAIPVPAAA